MAVAAFFDLDKTLLTVNSGRLWMQRERRLGRISFYQSLQAVFYFAAYKFGIINMHRAMGKAAMTIRGLPEETVRKWTEDWYEEEVKPTAAPGCWPVIEDHRKQGHLLVLLTSSSPYESGAALRHFELEHALSTHFVIKDGCFTGEVVEPICFGPGKVLIAEQFAAEHDIDLDQSLFYSDSITDLPMLERVGQPRVVHPDSRLRRLAERRGWQILDWT